MALTSVIPASGGIVNAGDTITVVTDDAGGITEIKHVRSGSGESTETVYEEGPGYDTGFSGSYAEIGGVATAAFRRDAGWSSSPFTIKVTTASTTYDVSYTLMGEGQYPPDMQPFNDPVVGDLAITEDDVSVESNTAILDFDADTFTVTNPVDGKVRIVGTAPGSDIEVEDETNGVLTTGVTKFLFAGTGVTATHSPEPLADEVTVNIPGISGSVGTLSDVVTTGSGTPDNTVAVPASYPIVFDDGGAGDFIPFSVARTSASGADTSAVHVTTVDALRPGVKVVNQTDSETTQVSPRGIYFDSSGDSTFRISGGSVTTTGAGNSLQISAGDNTGTGGTGGDLVLTAGGSSTSAGGELKLRGGVGALASYSDVVFDQGAMVVDQPMYLAERALAAVDRVGYGQFWPNSADDGKPYFTATDGTDYDLTAGTASAQSLDNVITTAGGGTVDNAVAIPGANPVIFSDAGVGSTTPFTVLKTATGTGQGILVNAPNAAHTGISVIDAVTTGETIIRSDGVIFGDGLGISVGYQIAGVLKNNAADADYITITGGSNAGAGDGGDVFIDPGSSIGGTDGVLQLATQGNASAVNVAVSGITTTFAGPITADEGIGVTGNITVTGLVDTVDVALLKSDFDTHDGLTEEHIDWTVTGAEDIHLDRLSNIPAASTTVAGLVELAADGEDAANVAVQGNDARLDAFTTTQDGLVPQSGASTSLFLRGDAVWADPSLGSGHGTTNSIDDHGDVDIVTDAVTEGEILVWRTDEFVPEANPGSTGDSYAASHEADPTAHDADEIVYDPTGTNLSATDAQAAITELDTDLAAHTGLTNEHIDWTGASAGTIDPSNIATATTTTEGVVELAVDLETTTGLAVQAQDSRLYNDRISVGIRTSTGPVMFSGNNPVAGDVMKATSPTTAEWSSDAGAYTDLAGLNSDIAPDHVPNVFMQAADPVASAVDGDIWIETASGDHINSFRIRMPTVAGTENLSVDIGPQTGIGISWTLTNSASQVVATGTADMGATSFPYDTYTLTWEDTAFAYEPPDPNTEVFEITAVSGAHTFGPP